MSALRELALAALVALPGCSPHECVPGREVSCACEGGEGSRTCHKGSWEACLCPAVEPPYEAPASCKSPRDLDGLDDASQVAETVPGDWALCDGELLGDPHLHGLRIQPDDRWLGLVSGKDGSLVLDDTHAWEGIWTTLPDPAGLVLTEFQGEAAFAVEASSDGLEMRLTDPSDSYDPVRLVRGAAP